MENYSEFVDILRLRISDFINTPREIWDAKAIKLVNGQAGDELRRLVNIDTRRKYGAFFTDSLLAQNVLEYLKPDFTEDSVIYDPACGAGNLLIATKDFIRNSGLELKWQNHLLGTDIHPEFIEAAQLRLITNSLLKLKNVTLSEFKTQKNKKYSVKIADGLLSNNFYKKATHIIVNPPFNLMYPSTKLHWGQGKVSGAALFIDKIIEHSNPGVSIYAILPDVLRSGSRYEKWREMVKERCKIEDCKLLGQFDKYADVDVYALKLKKNDRDVIKKTNCPKSVSTNITNPKTLKDLFHICVGPVVDNRDLKEGPNYPYLISRGLKGWLLKKEIILKRKHKGRTFIGPMIVIKRTSRMGDSHRAVASIINIPSPIFIDNHLIVLTPISGTLKECKQAIKIIKDPRTNDLLNEKIRCRHLTVKSISEIPIWS